MIRPAMALRRLKTRARSNPAIGSRFSRDLYQSLKTTNKREAERRYRSICTEVEHDKFKLDNPSKTKFDEFCSLFIEKHATFKRSGWRHRMTLF